MSLIYEQLADAIEQQIDNGAFAPGTALPAIRALSRDRGVAVSTVIRAYHELERRDRIEARARAGFFVCASAPLLALPQISTASTAPAPVGVRGRIMQLLAAANDPEIVDFGAATPHPDFMPGAALEASSRTVWREQRRACVSQAFPPGEPTLRTQIASRLASTGCHVTPDEVVITNGCQEAISIALRLTTEPGDIVAVESPIYYGVLELIERLGRQVIEIPSHPEHGLSLEALALAAQNWPIKACVVIPTLSNPLGHCMPDENKRQLVAWAERTDTALIEDDIYGDFLVGGRRRRPLKSWDTSGIVYHCSSATKTVGAGLRIGWLVSNAGTQHDARYFQYVDTVSVQSAGQLVLADYYRRARADRERRRMSQAYEATLRHLSGRVESLFPAGTRLSRPRGGFVLWVELDPAIDTTEVANEALAAGISIAPGALFSTSRQFDHCLRLNSAQRWDRATENALGKLAHLISR